MGAGGHWWMSTSMRWVLCVHNVYIENKYYGTRAQAWRKEIVLRREDVQGFLSIYPMSVTHLPFSYCASHRPTTTLNIKQHSAVVSSRYRITTRSKHRNAATIITVLKCTARTFPQFQDVLPKVMIMWEIPYIMIIRVSLNNRPIAFRLIHYCWATTHL